jgi:guanylate kinase
MKDFISPKIRTTDGNLVENKSGRLFILSAPSGGGKTTLCEAVRNRISDIQYSVSYTTRKPRSGEKNGIDFHFIGPGDFEAGIATDTWAEWAKVHGHYYGTSAKAIETERAAGHDLLLDIDVQGTVQIIKRYPDAITIFIMPPSLEELRSRLVSRGTESQEQIETRLSIAEQEMANKNIYRHVIINDELSTAVEKLVSLIEAYRDERMVAGRKTGNKVIKP